PWLEVEHCTIAALVVLRDVMDSNPQVNCEPSSTASMLVTGSGVVMVMVMIVLTVVVAAVVLTACRGLQAADVLVSLRVPVDSDCGVFDAELLSQHRLDALDHS